VAGAESAHRRGGFGDLGCSGAVRTTADVIDIDGTAITG